jgi:hypothetical protein
MKRLILLVFAISVIAAMFYNTTDKKPVKVDFVKENGSNITDSKAPYNYQPSNVLDTLGSIPGMRGYYDYQTNGNNTHRIWVKADTVIATVDQTDSANAQLSTARRSFYQVSYNNGSTWEADAIMVSTDGNAYPDLQPMVLAGNRTVVMTGRQFDGAGTRHGYTGVDVLLGAGSFTNTIVGNNGSDNFGMPINANELGCGWLGGLPSDSIFYGKFNINTNTYSGTLLISAGVPASARQYTATNRNQNVAVAWWKSVAPTSLVYRESNNNGTSFGAETPIMTEGIVVNGTPVAPWFNADMIYKPGTTQLCMAFGTLLTGNFGTAGGYKLMFWSPTINGGTPVKVVDFANYPPMADTNIWNERLRNVQVGMTAMSHPGLAFSSNGSRLFVVYSGTQLDTVNSTNYSAEGSYNYNDIYVQYSDDNGATWSAPRNLTNTAEQDEIYPSISPTDNTPTVISITYQLSECPGSTSFTNTTTPICPVYQIYRKYDPVTGAIIGIQNISSEVPDGYSLNQNFPNPFNPMTKIRFELPKSGNVTLKVFNTAGQLVKVLAESEFTGAGTKEVSFDGTGLASGVYFYTLSVGEFRETKKMVLVK